MEIFRVAAANFGATTAPAVTNVTNVTNVTTVTVLIDAATWGRLLDAARLSSAIDLEGRPIDPFTGFAVETADELLADPHVVLRSRCETSNGVPMHPHDVLRAALAGSVRRAAVDSQSVVIDLGRRQRLFTGSAREAAKLVVRHCEHPGCELLADWCEVDHMVEWGDHGVTDQRNSALQCDGHNRAKHRRRWRTRRRADGRLVTHRADGTMMLPVGVRPPTFPPDDEIEHGAGDSPEDIAPLTALVRQRVLALRSA